MFSIYASITEKYFPASRIYLNLTRYLVRSSNCGAERSSALGREHARLSHPLCPSEALAEEDARSKSHSEENTAGSLRTRSRFRIHYLATATSGLIQLNIGIFVTTDSLASRILCAKSSLPTLYPNFPSDPLTAYICPRLRATLIHSASS